MNADKTIALHRRLYVFAHVNTRPPGQTRAHCQWHWTPEEPAPGAIWSQKPYDENLSYF